MNHLDVIWIILNKLILNMENNLLPALWILDHLIPLKKYLTCQLVGSLLLKLLQGNIKNYCIQDKQLSNILEWVPS